VHDKVKQVLQDRCGDYWLATEGGGVVRYRPQDAPPAVRLVEVVADRRYDPDQEVHLPDTQQLVIFGFQGRSWSTPPERLAYVYRLDGYETEWKPVYRPRVEYRDLPRGEYTFQVRAVDRDLNYSEPASVRVRVEPDPRLEGLSQALNGPAVDFVGESRALRWLRAQLEQAAPTELTVLLLGETGKGLAARVVHRLSRRRGPLIPVSCGSLPEGLVESELFGHEKGAFTGAHARQLGKVELAQGGTLFLDEVGDLPLLAQAKLLRLLEEGTFERVGGTQELRSAARIVAATNRDLEGMVTAGSFRQDLYYRLQVVPVRLPPLRERREDIPLLAAYFLERMASHLRKRVVRLSPAALARLCGYDWPGNVRELEHAVKRAVVVCQGEVVAAEDLLGLPDRSEPGAGRLNPEEYERQYLQEVLEQTNWVISGPKGAATRLGMPESSLRFRMRKLGLRRP
jgi:transcriptional regulator with GAF, ATPase, and Fis domain